jgi:hypothetical protein
MIESFFLETFWEDRGKHEYDLQVHPKERITIVYYKGKQVGMAHGKDHEKAAREVAYNHWLNKPGTGFVRMKVS